MLRDEKELVAKVKSVAERRRTLPPGGELKEDYVFQWANDGKVGQRVKFSELFGDKSTLLNTWAKQRGWSQIPLVSGFESAYQADYKCQANSDDMQLPVMHVFTKKGGKIFHFWGTETTENHVDTVWPYWNLMDFTPEGRPDIPVAPQNFRSEFLEKNYLHEEG